MKITVKTTFDFGKLAKYVSSGEFSAQANRILGAHVADASKRFIMQGKVKPELKPSTRKRRSRMGITQNAPLFRTGTLANSLKPVNEGIKGAHYGKDHLKGYPLKRGNTTVMVQPRDFIVFEEERIKKPFNTLMKKMGRALKK